MVTAVQSLNVPNSKYARKIGIFAKGSITFFYYWPVLWPLSVTAKFKSSKKYVRTRPNKNVYSNTTGVQKIISYVIIALCQVSLK